MTKILVLYYDTCMSPFYLNFLKCDFDLLQLARTGPAGAAISQMAQRDALSYNCKLFTLEVPLCDQMLGSDEFIAFDSDHVLEKPLLVTAVLSQAELFAEFHGYDCVTLGWPEELGGLSTYIDQLNRTTHHYFQWILGHEPTVVLETDNLV